MTPASRVANAEAVCEFCDGFPGASKHASNSNGTVLMVDMERRFCAALTDDEHDVTP